MLDGRGSVRRLENGESTRLTVQIAAHIHHLHKRETSALWFCVHFRSEQGVVAKLHAFFYFLYQFSDIVV